LPQPRRQARAGRLAALVNSGLDAIPMPANAPPEAVDERHLDFLVAAAQTLGPVLRYESVGLPVVLVSEPELIRSVLRAPFEEITIGPAMEAERPIFGNGILLNYTRSWRPRRLLIQPPLSHRASQSFAAMIARRAYEHLRQLTGVVDVGAEMWALTLGVIVEALFSREVARVIPPVETLVRVHRRYFAQVLAGTADSDHDEELQRAVREMRRLVDELIQERRRAGDANDLFQLILTAKDEAGRGLDDEAIRDEVITLILAGHETTATALTWAFSLLGRHAEVFAALQQQLAARAGPERRALLSLQAPPPLARQAIEETLRLYPLLYFLDRTTVRPFRLGHHLLPPGTVIQLATWVVHRDQRWFPDPNAFRPERFADVARKQIPKFAYFPFGGGPKICVGNHFALLESSIVLATFAYLFDFQLFDLSPPKLWLTETLQPQQPIRLRLRARRPVAVSAAG
jgi:cytochrome P450